MARDALTGLGAHARGRGAEAPALSVVIPTLDEHRALAELLGDLRIIAVPHEVIVADGGSTDATCDVAAAAGARVVQAARGRGVQLAAGARAARAAVLCFLHADVRLDAAALRQLERVVRAGAPDAYAFRLAIAAPGAPYRVIERTANLRARLMRLPYGDQGLIVSRATYDRVGGYPELPIMEDVAMARALRRVTSVRLLPAAARVSARRWQREGVARRTLRNWALLVAYLLGAPPARLASRYRPAGDASPRQG